MYLKYLFQIIILLFFGLSVTSLQAQPTECFPFENLEIGQEFGRSAGQIPGDKISLLFNSDVITTLEPFKYQVGEEDGFWGVSVVDWNIGSTEIIPPYLFISNINLVFDFTPLPDVVSQVSFDFSDGGGELNFQVNDEEIYLLDLFGEAKRDIAKGVELTIEGKRLFLNGDIKKLAIGGQELGFDNFCYVVNDVPPLCIANLNVQVEPCTQNEGFFANIQFNLNSPPSDSFFIRGNGQVYGQFAYGQNNYRIGPIEYNSELVYEFEVIDQLDDNCINSINVGKIICEPSVCSVKDLNLTTSACKTNGLFDISIDFNHEFLANPNFEVTVGDKKQEDLVLSDLPITIKDVQLSTTGENLAKICVFQPSTPLTNDVIQCCFEEKVEFIPCVVKESCNLRDLEMERIGCNLDATYDLEFDFKTGNINANSLDYDILIDGKIQTYRAIGLRNRYIIDEADIGIGEHEMMVCFEDSLTQCCTSTIFETEKCSVTCVIADLQAETNSCKTDSTFSLAFNFDPTLMSDSMIKVFLDDKFYDDLVIPENGEFKIDQLQLPAGNHELKLCGFIIQGCCETVTFSKPPNCDSDTCNISNVIAEAHPCDSLGNFLVDIGFKVENPESDQFQILGNSNNYGTFEYGQPFYTIGPIKNNEDTTYEFIIQDLQSETCTSLIKLEKTINCEDENVWPGDTNDDNITDNFDLLNIGLAFEKIGPERTINLTNNTATEWESQAALDWDFQFKNGINAKHADCNGDGVIDEKDVIVLNDNYLLSNSSTKDKILSENSEIAPPFYVDFPTLSDIEKGTPLEVPIILGSTDIPVEAYGLAFTLKYDPKLITNGEVVLTESWFGTPEEDFLTINKNFTTDGLIEVALVKKGGGNPLGAGAIGNFIVTIDDIEGYSGEGSIEIQKVQAIDNEGNILAIHALKTVISSLTNTDETFEENDKTITLYPNPTSDLISINGPLDKSIDKVEIYAITGHLIQTVNPQIIQNIDISNMKNGVYIVAIGSGFSTIYRKLIKQ